MPASCAESPKGTTLMWTSFLQRQYSFRHRDCITDLLAMHAACCNGASLRIVSKGYKLRWMSSLQRQHSFRHTRCCINYWQCMQHDVVVPHCQPCVQGLQRVHCQCGCHACRDHTASDTYIAVQIYWQRMQHALIVPNCPPRAQGLKVYIDNADVIPAKTIQLQTHSLPKRSIINSCSILS